METDDKKGEGASGNRILPATRRIDLALDRNSGQKLWKFPGNGNRSNTSLILVDLCYIENIRELIAISVGGLSLPAQNTTPATLKGAAQKRAENHFKAT
jgi:hypothetical protein